MKGFATHYPVLFAVIVTLAGMFILLWPMLVTAWSLTTQMLVGRVCICVLAVGLLVRLGWWREVGFVRPASWRVVVPFLPLLVLLLLQLAGLAVTGIHASGWDVILVGLVTYGLGGFMEEAVFRGLVLRALRPRGFMRAALLGSLIFGTAHVANLLAGANLAATALQVASAVLVGFAFIGPLAYTGNIWPLVVIHFLNNFINYLVVGGFVNTAATSKAPGLEEVAPALIVGLVIALYSFWLLRRINRLAPQVPPVGALQQA